MGQKTYNADISLADMFYTNTGHAGCDVPPDRGIFGRIRTISRPHGTRTRL